MGSLKQGFDLEAVQKVRNSSTVRVKASARAQLLLAQAHAHILTELNQPVHVLALQGIVFKLTFVKQLP
jgi:hypothetical protein